MLGIDGSRDILVLKDAFRVLRQRILCPIGRPIRLLMPLGIFMGDRMIERFYSDRSGEIERALRDLHIVSDTSQPGVPQNNAVAERLVQDILEGTRTALLRAGLPPCFWNMRANIID